MPDGADHLDYLALVNEARHLSSSRIDSTSPGSNIRIALLADFSTQHLFPLLRALLARHGMNGEFYEAEYDVIDTEILNPASGLYAFAPTYIVILVATEKLKSRLYAAADRADFAAQTLARFTRLWDAVKQHSRATIIQGNYVLPAERAFGHYEQKTAESVGAVISEINFLLARQARAESHVLLCDVDHIAAEAGRANFRDETLWTLAKGFCRLDHLPRLAAAIVDIARAASGKFTKCVVLDLDNTLWGGVIGDDGLAGIALGDFDEGEAFVAFQHFIKELKRRGIILAVVSKNDEANALLPFREHPRMVLKEDDIAVFIANWQNKADNIRAIQKILNIGFDSMVFLDDNPMERDLVRQFLPEVTVPDLPEDPAQYLRALAGLNLFETASHSAADRERAGQYREEARREQAKQIYQDIGDYLRSLEMKIKIERFSPFNLPRIAQLIQRSNQFNLTTRRHNQAACEAMMNDARCSAFSVSLEDKFGDYGLISVVILRHLGQDIDIETYLMSCRVLQRGVEQFVMNAIFALARRVGADRVTASYIKTAKNGMVENFYPDFGFERVDATADGGVRYALDCEAYQTRTTFITPSVVEI